MSYIWKHFKTVCKHKWIVFRECVSCGIAWQGLVHDLSKFSPTEFIPSAKHFQGNRSPIDAEKDDLGYSTAWLHHKGRNKHHWEYWTDFDDAGGIIANKIPYEYVVEMVCDWIGAGMVYSKEKWTPAATLDYYDKVRSGRHFHPVTEGLIIGLLVTLRHEGLKGFHRGAKSKELRSFYRTSGSKTIVPAEENHTPAPTASHSERDILDACVELMQGMADDFLEYLDWVGYEPEEYEKISFCDKTYFEIVQRLFLWNTNHSGGTSTDNKCRELGVNRSETIAYNPWKDNQEVQE